MSTLTDACKGALRFADALVGIESRTSEKVTEHDHCLSRHLAEAAT